MKKLMIAMAIAGAVGFAQATLTDPVRFTDDTVGQHLYIAPGENASAWAAAEADLEGDYVTSTVVTNNDAGAEGNYLALDGVEKLERFTQMSREGVDIGDGFYIDTLVKFTAAEEEPQTTTGDKICIWLKSNESDPTQCKLMVTAGYVNDDVGASIIPTNYETTVTIADGSWQHLRVKVLKEIDSDGSQALSDGFVIFIGDNAVTTTLCPISSYNPSTGEDNNLDNYTLNARAAKYFNVGAYAIFPSMVALNAGGDGEITSLAFSGSGAVDELSFSQGNDIDPIILPVPTAITGLTYTGSAQKGISYPEFPAGSGDSLEDVQGEIFEASGDEDSQTGAQDTTTTYTTIFTTYPGYAWEGGVFGATNITWSIGPQATPSEGWVDDPTTIPENTSAGTQYTELAGTALATADAKALTTWAKANSVSFTDAENETTIGTLTEAFLLNCANTTAAIAEEKEEFVLTITVAADGTPTVSLPDGKTYNGKVQMKGSNDLSTWTDVNAASTTYHFYKYELSL